VYGYKELLQRPILIELLSVLVVTGIIAVVALKMRKRKPRKRK
jgi:hypothetical protein